MEMLDRIVGELKDAFKYCKTRTKNKYYGDRFEEWVVKNSNISKDGSAYSNGGKPFWKLLEWRGDKYIDGYRPLSSSAPDLLLECISNCSTVGYEVGDIIAVECKWRSEKGFYLEWSDVKKYEEYIIANEQRYPIKHLFYVFGFGWSCGQPEQVYIIPAKELYEYDKSTRAVKFISDRSIERKNKRLEGRERKFRFLVYCN